MNEDPNECVVPGCPAPHAVGLRRCSYHADPRSLQEGAGSRRGSFGWAIEALKRGQRVARRGWNGRGMWLALWRGGTYAEDAEFLENCEPAREYATSCASNSVDVGPSIVMKTADGSLVVGWLASQTDMLAEDWIEVVG